MNQILKPWADLLNACLAMVNSGGRDDEAWDKMVEALYELGALKKEPQKCKCCGRVLDDAN